MAILQVRDIDDRVYENLKQLAQKEKRSLSQEVIFIIESFLSNPQNKTKNSTEEFLSLSGSWDDERSANEIVKDIRINRRSTTRFGRNNVIFD